MAAARKTFTKHGYDGVGVREIAAAADVNVALVNRYFGSKKGLFQEAILETIAAVPAISDRRALRENLINHILYGWPPDQETFDPTRAMMRSSGNEQIEELLRSIIDVRLIDPVVASIGNDDANTRAGLTIAVMAGVSILRDVLGLSVLSNNNERLESLLKEVLSVLLDVGPNDGASPSADTALP